MIGETHTKEYLFHFHA